MKCKRVDGEYNFADAGVWRTAPDIACSMVDENHSIQQREIDEKEAFA